MVREGRHNSSVCVCVLGWQLGRQLGAAVGGGSWGGSWGRQLGMATKRARRLALLEAGGEPNGTGTPCADCETPSTILNTSVAWSDAAKTRLTFHYAVCDACRSARLCQKLRDDPAAKLVQMGADAAARTKRPHYGGEVLAASECTALIASLLTAQRGKCASCAHAVDLAAHAGIFMASLDKVGDRYDDGTAQVLCLGCQRLFNDLPAAACTELTRAIVEASDAPRPDPLAALPVEFERSVATKVAQMKQREAATDRPLCGAPVELSVAAGCRRLRHCGLRCVCARRTMNPRPRRTTRPPAHLSRPTRSPRLVAGQCDQRAAQRDRGQPVHVVL